MSICNSSRSRALAAASLALISLSVASGRALASPNYPSIVQDQWGLSYTPPCTICHATDSGGKGTVVKYFGQQLQAFGLEAGNNASLIAALARDKGEHTDCDGSGVPDYDKLVAHIDPNAGPGPATASEHPEYGCTIARTNGTSFHVVIAISLLAMLALAVRRRSTGARF